MELNENYRIITDANNVTLQYHEVKTRTVKGSNPPVKEEYEVVDDYYYPTIKTALVGFLNRGIKPSKDFEDCLKRINEVETIIKGLKI